MYIAIILFQNDKNENIYVIITNHVICNFSIRNLMFIFLKCVREIVYFSSKSS